MRRREVRIAAWAAPVLFLAFAWAELVWVDNSVPAALAVAILLYSGITWVAMARYGVQEWLRRGEIFSILFGLFGRFAPLRREAGKRLSLRPFAAGLAVGGPLSPPATVFVIALLATVSFDGFLHTPPWNTLYGAAYAWAYEAGLLGNVGVRTVIMTAGLLTAPLVFLAVYRLVCTVTARLLSRASGTVVTGSEVARRFAPTLVPIAIAYHLSHYLSLLLIEGQRLYGLVSDPFGVGWNLFGTAGFQPDIAIVDARFLWVFAIAAIVAGHMRPSGSACCRAGPTRRPARRPESQFPMLVLMVGYTFLSLWILAQPIVET